MLSVADYIVKASSGDPPHPASFSESECRPRMGHFSTATSDDTPKAQPGA